MLIFSPRHTRADLRLWAEYEAGDLARGQSLRMQERIVVAKDAIARFVADGPCYCGVSWGKDSVVVAWLLQQVAPHVPMVWVKVPGHNPDCAQVRDLFLERFPARYAEIEVERGSKLTSAKGFAEADRQFGSRHISGLRADESGGRAISLRRHGPATARTCRPLGWWSAEDVFAVLASSALPVHPAYAMLGGGRWERRHLRVASLGGVRGTQFGRREWEAEYYGDVLSQIGSE